MLSLVAVTVKELQVVHPSQSTTPLRVYVIHLHNVSRLKEEPTNCASPFLSLE